MDIKQLHYFRTIVEEGQITRAAKILHMAQPPLSQSLKTLEKELGTALIIRHAKKLELTQAGKILYQRAVHLLNLMDETKSEIQELGEGVRGTLSIGAASACMSYIPDRIQQLREAHPDLYFRIYQGDTYYLEELLENRDIEVAVARLPVDSQHFQIKRLPKEPFIVVVPAKWQANFLSNKIELKDIAPYPILMLKRIKGTSMFESLFKECYESGFKPNVIAECPDVSTVIALVTAGVGITIIPKSEFHMAYNHHLRILELSSKTSLQSEPVVMWRNDNHLSKAAEKFIETFKT